MSTGTRGGQIRLEAIFHEYAGGPLFDPDQPITLDIHYNNVSVLTTPFTYSGGDIVRDGVGLYHAIWSIPVSANLGEYHALWSATIFGTPVTGVEEFEILPTGTVTPGEQLTFGTDQYITFAGDITPMCLDPDELVIYFPEANYLEIAIAVRNATMDMQSILRICQDECVDDPLALEYIKAAAACALSKVYGNGAFDGDGLEATRIKLGDLEVERGSGGVSTNRGRINPTNATTWCELAGALRNWLISSNVGMRAVVKGAAYCSPIPRRHFSTTAGDWPRRHRQGDLDDPPYTKNWSG